MTGWWVVGFCTLWAVVVLLGFLVLGSLRRVSEVVVAAEEAIAAAVAAAQFHGLGRGSTVPPFVAATADGALFALDQLTGRRSVVLFLTASCSACDRLATDLREGALPNFDARLVVVSAARTDAEQFVRAGVPVLVDEDRSVARAFASNRTPQAFVVDETGVVLGSGSPNDWESLRRLIADSTKGGELLGVDLPSAAVVMD